jgi:hypothetical protein
MYNFEAIFKRVIFKRPMKVDWAGRTRFVPMMSSKSISIWLSEYGDIFRRLRRKRRNMRMKKHVLKSRCGDVWFCCLLHSVHLPPLRCFFFVFDATTFFICACSFFLYFSFASSWSVRWDIYASFRELGVFFVSQRCRSQTNRVLEDETLMMKILISLFSWIISFDICLFVCTFLFVATGSTASAGSVISAIFHFTLVVVLDLSMW